MLLSTLLDLEDWKSIKKGLSLSEVHNLVGGKKLTHLTQ